MKKKQTPMLPLVEFRPVSMLRVRETILERPRYPVIDIHAHLSWGPAFSSIPEDGGRMDLIAPVEDLLPTMDRMNIRIIANLTGGCGSCFDETLEVLTRTHPDRFAVFVEPWYTKIREKEFPIFQAEELERARRKGAKGLKVLKTLGLYLREHITSGSLVNIGDPRFDPMWDAAGALEMPVLIHTSDPEAFFLPIDNTNERYEELHVHPDWSFYGSDFPSSLQLHTARNEVIARHPNTNFILAHSGMSEDLGIVSEWLDAYPNMYVDISARIGEFGRQPRAARRFFDRYQDRILFGTDAIPNAQDYPQQIFCDLLYQIYYRFLETDDEYFDYAPAPVPPQGRWRISGLHLPESILKKVYFENAARLLGL